ncbi:4'-phosphopantetheinyl transferase superfamily protein [Paraburkholderia sp. Tr-20389]|uniref:4'-phosphopantetheinyl transferase family protein n=1 Tax=Paraburkholderia sp. Tr-20389 TaxID=2703903 RepID=UPI00197CD465|nr:4'-phosphopantetheinyl transferase superfamily protein [Paraburkholderia sp. Tr-20389]MBN3754896.1 4'-phosphopantetheinyl transferase superfamily protein [Paraburkholderia sp. Tr-20389]
MNLVDCIPLPHPGPHDVALWRVDFAFDRTLAAPAFDTLSVEERERAARFHRHQDAIRFASVRAALRAVLSHTTKIDAGRIRIAADEAGRPCMLDSPVSVDFNVSHSGAHGLIALSTRRRVGVDIETRAPGFDWRSIARSTLTADELAWLQGLDAAQSQHAFFDAWVAKEALLKAVGVGISEHLTQLTVLPSCIGGFVPRKQRPLAVRTFLAAWTQAPQGYAACIAWSESPAEVTQNA